jgi:hypothetical protein
MVLFGVGFEEKWFCISAIRGLDGKTENRKQESE